MVESRHARRPNATPIPNPHPNSSPDPQPDPKRVRNGPEMPLRRVRVIFRMFRTADHDYPPDMVRSIYIERISLIGNSTYHTYHDRNTYTRYYVCIYITYVVERMATLLLFFTL